MLTSICREMAPYSRSQELPLHISSTSLSSSRSNSIDFPASQSPYHPLIPAGFLNYILCQHKPDVNKFLLVGQYWHVYVLGSTKKMSLVSLSLLLKQCLACLVCLTWMVFAIKGKWQYSCGFCGKFQDLFKIAPSILM